METILKIEGMSCDHCVQAVKKSLESVGGVISADVNLSGKFAKVSHGEEVSLGSLQAAITEAGFELA